MNRRGFISLSIAGATASVIAPKTLLASSNSTSGMAGGLYITPKKRRANGVKK